MSQIHRTKFTNDLANFLTENALQTDSIPAQQGMRYTYALSQIESARTQAEAPHAMYRLTAALNRYTFDLEDEQNATVRAKKQGEGGVGLQACYVPWETGKTYCLRLSSQATYCLTANMTKCAVYITQGFDGSLVVYHSNYNCAEPELRQGVPFEQQISLFIQEQRGSYISFYEDLREFIAVSERSQAVSCLEPEYYIYTLGGTQAGVFGVYKNNAWKFCFQVWCKAGTPGAKMPSANKVGNLYLISGELWPNPSFPMPT